MVEIIANCLIATPDLPVRNPVIHLPVWYAQQHCGRAVDPIVRHLARDGIVRNELYLLRLGQPGKSIDSHWMKLTVNIVADSTWHVAFNMDLFTRAPSRVRAM